MIKCIKNFIIPIVNDDGFDTGEYKVVKMGSKWTINDDEGDFRLIGGDIRLVSIDSDTDLAWIEICKETFEEYFDIIR
ncbi:hypothetical protein [Caminicella sporogenes]|nr:hypothetical protein [Caminicella sporogenes]